MINSAVIPAVIPAVIHGLCAMTYQSAMHCSPRLAPTMINHLTSIHIVLFLDLTHRGKGLDKQAQIVKLTEFTYEGMCLLLEKGQRLCSVL